MKELVNELKEIVKKSGEKIMDVYEDEKLLVESKSDKSPLTLADRLSNEVIVEGLESLIPRYPIISEENKQVDYEIRSEYERFWLVDPLDGTKEFIKRNGEFTVNIALIEDGMPILGIVYIPVTGETYWALKEQGAFYDDGKELKKLQSRSFTMKDSQLKIVCSRSHINEDTKKFIDQLDNPTSVSRGSSLKFLIIARGEADLYPRLGPTMEWDTAAAQIILEESGGKVLRHDSGEPLDYNKESLLNPYFIASGNIS